MNPIRSTLLSLSLLVSQSALARDVTVFPMTENFNSAGQYADVVCNDPAVSSFAHQSTQGWNGSGAAKFTFVNGPEDNSGLCGFNFAPSLSPRRVNIRFLIFYGPEFFEVASGFGGKNAILLRCNSNCTGEIVPSGGLRSSAY